MRAALRGGAAPNATHQARNFTVVIGAMWQCVNQDNKY
jgi:hypothetical protein